MKIIGVIIEGNPIHNGHLHLVNTIKEKYQPDYLIAVTSGNFTMRGEVSAISKYEKVKGYLKLGFDLVFELPIVNTLQSASFFAEHSVSILNNLGVNMICCGIENDSLDFNTLYKTEQSKEFKDLLEQNIKSEQSYKKAMIKTFKDLIKEDNIIDDLNLPNATLAYEYFKAIKNNNYPISLNFIKRNDSLKSATSIKQLFKENKRVSKYLPFKENLIDLIKAEKNLIKLFKFDLLFNNNNNEVINYIKNNLEKIDSLSDLKLISSKNFTTSLLRRNILKSLLRIDDTNQEDNYLRLLGSNKKGLTYLSLLDKNIKDKIFSSPNEFKNLLLSKELDAAKLLDLITDDKTYLQDEYKIPYMEK